MNRKQRAKPVTSTTENIAIETVETPVVKLRIVAADELSTAKPGANRHRSQLVQSFIEFSDQLDAEIAKLWEL